jgi:hypothetical protein
MRRLLACALVCLAGTSLALAARRGAYPREDTPWYTPKATWQETLRVSRDALARNEAEAEKKLAASLARSAFKPVEFVLEPATAPRHIRLDVSGLDRLVLRTVNAHEKRRGHFTVIFGTPTLSDAEGKSVPVTGKAPLYNRDAGMGHLRNERDGRWREANLTGKFETGVMLQREVEAVFELGGKFKSFEAWVQVLKNDSWDEAKVAVHLDVRAPRAEKSQREADRRRLWELIRKDFASPLEMQQQQFEERDSIWRDDWEPGDTAGPAGRYASRCDGDVRDQAMTHAKAARTPEDLAAVRGLYYAKAVKERVAFCRRTLEFVEESAPRPTLAAALAAIEQTIRQAELPRPTDWLDLYARTFDLRRRIILSHPLLDFDRLLINKRPPPGYSHMCDQYLGRHSRPGPGIVVLDDWKSDTPKETVLLEGRLHEGTVMHPELSYDAERLLFAYCSHEPKQRQYRRFWIYEINVDGTGLRQLTGTDKDPRQGWEGRATVIIEDWDPVYAPGGGFVFISTRSQTYGRCHGSRYVPTYMVFRADADGSNIRQLSFGEANEWNPCFLHDGRIVYTRWDYINRHDTRFQSLWSMRPDGTNTAHFYGNYSTSPCMIAEARPIPGSHKIVATAMAHHSYTTGTAILVDPSVARDGQEPIIRITPEIRYPEASDRVGGGGRGAFNSPWPLSEDLFLMAYTADDHAWQGRVQNTNAYAIYLVDTLGGRELIYRDPDMSCFSPMPIQPRPEPARLPSHLPPAYREEKTGVLVVQDVHRSSEDIPAGTIKSLRVNQIYGQPTNSKPQLSRANNEIIKGTLGTVPVSDDGSVAFRAPAGVPFQLQALDGNGMAVMTMRSLIYVQPGETASCVGCHEERSAASLGGAQLKDVTIRNIEPPAGPRYSGGFSFVKTVQPVLDRYCIGCHGLEGEPKGGINLLGTPTSYNRAHDSLVERRGLVKIAYRNGETAFSRPKDYFAHAGKLVQVITEKHKDRVKLDRDSLLRIINWLDLNTQFFGDYSRNRVEQRRPDAAGEKALRAHIAEVFGEKLARQPFEALVNVGLPTESRILKAPLAKEAGGWGQVPNGWSSTEAPGYQKMLELVNAAIAPLSSHDVAGTCGSDRCRCGCCWVRKLREEYQKAGKEKADKTAMK